MHQNKWQTLWTKISQYFRPLDHCLQNAPVWLINDFQCLLAFIVFGIWTRQASVHHECMFERNDMLFWQCRWWDKLPLSGLNTVEQFLTTVDWQALSCSSPVCWGWQPQPGASLVTFLAEIRDWNSWGVLLPCSTRIWESWQQWELAMTTAAFHQSGWLNMFLFAMMSLVTPTGMQI